MLVGEVWLTRVPSPLRRSVGSPLSGSVIATKEAHVADA
jgi:hypothetical protein